MQVTTAMVAILLIWCPVTLLLRGAVEVPPAPTPSNLRFSRESLGWLEGTFWPGLAPVALLIAFGHSLLAMSGFETLAQVYREIGYPKIKNLRLTATIVCTYALVGTGLISLFAVMIVPDESRPNYYNNLIGGLAMNLAGPAPLRLVFHVFVVAVGAAILSGAVNTSIIGANGMLNRVAEDCVLLKWFRKPHPRFGTTYRIINLITALQLATLLASRGDVLLLGEAYAFGIVWSFFLKGLGVLALRNQRHDQEYRTPLNLRVAGIELPLGLVFTTLVLLSVAVVNLFTKQIATIYGVTFTVLLFLLFKVSELVNVRKLQKKSAGLEEFNLVHTEQLSAQGLGLRPGSILVAVRDYGRMVPVQRVLDKTNLRRHDIVVMTVRPLSVGAGEYDLAEEQYFGEYEQELFSNVVQKAEKAGKPVALLTVVGVDPFQAMVRAAADLKASRLVTGVSAQMTSEELARRIGLAWEKLPEPHHPFSLEVIAADREPIYVNLGPHPPRLWPSDIELLHELWLDLSSQQAIGSAVHHRDLVGLALTRLKRDLSGGRRDEVLTELLRLLRKQ